MGGRKRRIGTNFQDEEGTAAPSRDRLSSALSREIATIEITSGAEGGRRDSDEFSFMLKEPPSTPTTIRAETSHFASHPPCLPPPFYFLYSPYTRAHPFASLNLHYFNVALCPTLPFLSIGSTRALLNFQFQFLFFLLSRLFLFAVHLQTLQSPLSSFYGRY